MDGHNNNNKKRMIQEIRRFKKQDENVGRRKTNKGKEERKMTTRTKWREDKERKGRQEER